MKRKSFSGIAVHPDHVTPGKPTIVGVWFGFRLSAEQRRLVYALRKSCSSGAIGLQETRSGTSIKHVLRVADSKSAREAAKALVREVAQITGARSILRKLPNYRAVSRALAI